MLPSGGGVGYGGFELDAASLDYLVTHLPEIDDPLTRGAAWITLWEQMLDRRTTASSVVDLALRALPRETDEQNVQRDPQLLRGRRTGTFLPAPARDVVAPSLEQVLRSGLTAAPTSSLKSAWFSALRDVARTETTLAWLERVWRKTRTCPA